MSTPHSSSLFLLSELKKERIKEAFKNEEINRNRQEKSTPSSSVLLASSPAPSTSKFCDWCNSPTHSTAECRSMAAARDHARKQKAA
jgi:hypothetical protein